ncbi:MAG: hypothetical protein HZA24_11870 [Nitrospirae bacterium]|nr:hypothetical protein [Nitrospirota bacterium]
MIADETPPPLVVPFNTIPRNAMGPMIQDETPWSAGPFGPAAPTALDRQAANGWRPAAEPTPAFQRLGIGPGAPFDPTGIHPRLEAYRPEWDMAADRARADVPIDFTRNFNARVRQGVLDTQTGLALGGAAAAGAAGFGATATHMGTAAEGFARQAGRYHPQGVGADFAETVGSGLQIGVSAYGTPVGAATGTTFHAANAGGEAYRTLRELGVPHESAAEAAIAAMGRDGSRSLMGGVAARLFIGPRNPVAQGVLGDQFSNVFNDAANALSGPQDKPLQ